VEGSENSELRQESVDVITPPSTIPVPHTLKQGRVLLGALQIGPHPHRCGSGLSSSPGPARATPHPTTTTTITPCPTPPPLPFHSPEAARRQYSCIWRITFH
ncbi:hypothetical protein Pcinc_042946, partial [Petrolisthes cinctipes]